MRNSQKDFHKKLLGREGERLAVGYLKKLGYKILETNYVTPFGEADIIALNGKANLVFIEVKTRSSTIYGTPSEAVNYKKQQKYRSIASFYINKNGYDDFAITFSVVEVLGGEINFISEAF